MVMLKPDSITRSRNSRIKHYNKVIATKRVSGAVSENKRRRAPEYGSRIAKDPAAAKANRPSTWY